MKKHALHIRVPEGNHQGQTGIHQDTKTMASGRSVVQVLVVEVDIGGVIYEAMTPQCGRSVVQVLVVRVDIGVVTYEAMTS